MILKTLHVYALAVWLGGLTFYAVVVIPVGAEVLGGHRDFGFITRQVTPRLNLIGIGVIVASAIALVANRTPGRTRWLWTSWAVMAAAQAALFLLHPWLDALLEPGTRGITDDGAFYRRHQLYLWTTAIQWLGTLAHLHLVLQGRNGTGESRG